jgi:ribose-phosphate pyrophosphokinase
MDVRAPMALIACSDARALVERVATHLGSPVAPSHDVWFDCGEGKHVIEANVRGTDIFVIQQAVVPGSPRSIYDRLLMALHACDAARLAGAERVTLVLPYLPGGRQDKRKEHAREGVSTGMFARLFTAAGIDMVVTVNPHNEATIGCYDPRHCILEGLTITPLLGGYLRDEGIARDVVASTDLGGLEMARAYARFLAHDIVALSKERDYSRTSVVVNTQLLGDVAGRSVLIIDDIIDTAGSISAAIRTLWQHGATDITAAAVHLLMSGPAWERFAALHAEAEARGVDLRLVGTSAITPQRQPSWYGACPIEPLLADVIRRINTRASLRALE